MSELKLRPFEQQLANVIYANRLEQAEKRGYKIGYKIGYEKEYKKRIEQGIEQGKTNIIKKLLKKNTAEEISKQYDIPLEKIQRIQKKNEK